MKKMAFILAFGLFATAASAQAQNPRISPERARAIALRNVPNNEGIKSEKLKMKDGLLVYEFDLDLAGPGHQEIRVDANTGAIVGNKHEGNAYFTSHDISRMNLRIDEGRARQIALRQVPGGYVKDIHLKRHDGVLFWEVKVDVAGPGHYDLMINANSGAVTRQKFDD